MACVACSMFTSESVAEGHPDKLADQIFGADPGAKGRRQVP